MRILSIELLLLQSDILLAVLTVFVSGVLLLLSQLPLLYEQDRLENIVVVSVAVVLAAESEGLLAAAVVLFTDVVMWIADIVVLIVGVVALVASVVALAVGVVLVVNLIGAEVNFCPTEALASSCKGKE